MDTQQEQENGNGTPTPTPEKTPPEFFQADRADALEMLVLIEREGRLNVEARGLQAAKRELVNRLNAKYGVDIMRYTIDSETGIAKKNGS
jgi:hypothetical protein